MFSKKATKIEKIFTLNLTLCSKCQIDGEDFINFCGLLKGQFISKAIFSVLDSSKNERKRFDLLYYSTMI